MYVATYLSQKSIGNPRSIPGSQTLSETLFLYLFLFFIFPSLELLVPFPLPFPFLSLPWPRTTVLVPFLQTLNSCPNDSSSSPPAPFHIVRISNQENHSCDCRSKPETSLLPVLSSLQHPPSPSRRHHRPSRLLCPFSLPSRPSISAPRSSIPSQPHRCKNIPAPRSLDRCGREDCWGGGKG